MHRAEIAGWRFLVSSVYWTRLFSTLAIRPLAFNHFASRFGGVKEVARRVAERVAKGIASGTGKFYRSSLSTVFLLALVASAIVSTAAAQADNSKLSLEDQQLLDEIIVTAQKKQQPLLDAPVSVSYFSAERIGLTQTLTAEELGRLGAGLTLFNDGSINSGVSIRGAGVEGSQLTPTRVGTYLDGLEVASRTSFAFANFYDVESVQVLRGPQGTLYGQPSPAGAVIIKTAAPDLQLREAYVQASVQDPEGYTVQGAVSLPLIEDRLAVRLAALEEQRDTGVRNIVRDEDEQRERHNLRLKTLYQPTDALSIALNWSRSDVSGSDFMPVLETIDPAAASAAAAAAGFTDFFELSASDRYSIADSAVGFGDAVTDTWGFNAEWRGERHSFFWTSVGYDLDEEVREDFDLTNLPLQYNDTDIHSESQQHEWRLLSRLTPWWETQVGAYYSKADVATTVRSLAGGLELTQVADTRIDLPLESKVTALFTHNEFLLNDATSLTIGLRYNDWQNASDASYSQRFFAFGAGGATIEPGGMLVENGLPSAVLTGIAFTDIKEVNAEELTGTIKLSHVLSDEAMIYMTYDRGYRPGSFNFNASGSFVGTEFNTYRGESVDTVELGVKGETRDGRAEVVVASYAARYRDFQANPDFELAYEPSPGLQLIDRSFLATVNVDEAKQWGIELEGRLYISEHTTAYAAVNYSDFEFTSGNIPCTLAGAALDASTNRFETCAASGEPASSQPRLTASLQLDYRREVGNGEWYATSVVSHRGDAATPGDSVGVLDTSSYSLVDLFAGYRNYDWGIKVWAKNVFDRDAVRRRNTTPDMDSGYIWVRQDPGRSVGLTLDLWLL